MIWVGQVPLQHRLNGVPDIKDAWGALPKGDIIERALIAHDPGSIQDETVGGGLSTEGIGSALVGINQHNR